MTAASPSPPTSGKTWPWPARIGWTLAALLCLGVVAYSARYLLHPPRTPAEALGNPFGAPWLFVHVAGASVALALGRCSSCRS
ncbi:hypothetical protein [Brevundimonas faecalis]|uniref:Uncharacterized protein n=1 Tax=Brevundimonas faecalis TaxID=947378 RepID=A0ABV2R8C6_9CAUL